MLVEANTCKECVQVFEGDNSAATEKEVDERVRHAFDQQDPDIIQDLREHNKGQPSKYDIFFLRKPKSTLSLLLKQQWMIADTTNLRI